MTCDHRSDETRTPRDSIARKTAYTLAAGAAAGAAGSADAAIVWSGPQDIDIALGASQPLNLDGDAYTDIFLNNYDFGAPYQGVYVQYFPGNVVGFFGAFAYVSALEAGDVIDATTTAGGPFQASMAFGATNPAAEFNNADGAFIGLDFPIGGVTHFGWIRVTIDNAAGEFTINDWAYQSVPGRGLLAGDTVPEPGTLGMLAAGAAGVAAMRRRRAA
ncbi:MAG: PEP-CTERM sorting domain-containing protein [Planctomycetota bacterium]